jgi:putative flippase GtrA
MSGTNTHESTGLSDTEKAGCQKDRKSKLFESSRKYLSFLFVEIRRAGYSTHVRHKPSLGRLREIFLYLLTGILGVGVDLLFFFGGMGLGLPIIFSQWVGATAGTVHNALVYHYFVFNHNMKLRQTVFANVLISAGIIAVSGPALVVLGYYLNNLWIAKVFILAGTAILTYFLRKAFVFKR